jgi:hypothetical protein
LVDCVDIKFYEEILVRDVSSVESTIEDIVEVEMNMSKNRKKKTLSQMKIQILTQTQISNQHQILPPKLLKRIILQVR